MHKLLRLLVIAFSLTLTAFPSARADQMGANPHPAAAAPTMWDSLVYTVRSYLGI